MFSRWREYLTLPSFPPLRRPNSEPELNSPNFEAYSDDEWILVNEKTTDKTGISERSFKALTIQDEGSDGEVGDEIKISVVKKTAQNSINNPKSTEINDKNGLGAAESDRSVALNSNKGTKTKKRPPIDERILQRRQLEELLFEDNNPNNNYPCSNNYPNNYYKHHYKLTAKESRNQLRRRQKQTGNENKKRRRRDMSC